MNPYIDRSCVFCKIGNGEIKSDILFQDSHCFVIRDIAPKAPVHLLVIPNNHFTYLANLHSGFHSTLGNMLARAYEFAKIEGIQDEGYRLVINQGTNAGQQVEHLHIHVLGGRPLMSMG